jgi:hypothetical protein
MENALLETLGRNRGELEAERLQQLSLARAIRWAHEGDEAARVAAARQRPGHDA